MNLERTILVAFIGNYLINNIVAALVALIPATASTSTITPQYIAYVVLAAIFAAGFAWWTMKAESSVSIMSGVYFGVIAFVVSILTAFVTGITGVLAQTGSLSQMFQIIPNFIPFIISWSTPVLLAYWLVPAVAIAYMLQKKSAPAASQTM